MMVTEIYQKDAECFAMLLAHLSQKDILTFGYASIKFSATEVRP